METLTRNIDSLHGFRVAELIERPNAKQIISVLSCSPIFRSIYSSYIERKFEIEEISRRRMIDDSIKIQLNLHYEPAIHRNIFREYYHNLHNQKMASPSITI